jgi:hypothetical protein
MACTYRSIACLDGAMQQGIETLITRLIVVLVDSEGEPILDDDGQPKLALRVVNECDAAAE